jgi:hypothetical protein
MQSVVQLNVIMLSVSMLNAIMLSVIMLNVVMLSAIMLNAIMLSVIMLNVIMLSVVAPKKTVLMNFFSSSSWSTQKSERYYGDVYEPKLPINSILY